MKRTILGLAVALGATAAQAACEYGYADAKSGLCNDSPAQVAQGRREYEKRHAVDEKDSRNRVQSIPGVCVGDDCNRVVKIQRWDAHTGAMVN
ncbi:hypothetical protein LGM38_14845 [Burkholderia vietnamiensis]|uniref:hypothetical protein n=1 Tax=Burkholderia vietnamiensis TaxID=60552 RepID=UPI001CF33120|nr:hypothetical protein [Burkholderia vietnamiensis]MCA8013327.1 hypothetical protein [Burkholderia vietnamiensis]